MSYLQPLDQSQLMLNDNNMHTISIMSPNHDDTIVEGAGFSFTLTATPPANEHHLESSTLNVETTPYGVLS